MYFLITNKTLPFIYFSRVYELLVSLHVCVTEPFLLPRQKQQKNDLIVLF